MRSRVTHNVVQVQNGKKNEQDEHKLEEAERVRLSRNLNIEDRPGTAGLRDIGSVLGDIYGSPQKSEEDVIRGGLAKFRQLGKKVLNLNRLKLKSEDIEKEKERRKKAQRADIACYVLFMFFFTLNTIDGLGDQSHYVFTQRVIDTLNMESFAEVNDVSGLNSWLENELVPGLYSDNFEGSNTSNVTSGATGWLIQGPVRVSQIRSDFFKCRHDIHPNLRNYPYQCTHSRNFDYLNGAFNEKYEAKETFRGFEYNVPNVKTVKFQREQMPYSWYETPMRHSFPAPAFAVLIDPHQPLQRAEETVARLVRDAYVDKQTNVVFIDLSIYNYILDFSAWVRFTAEFNSAGGVDCVYEVNTVQLYWPPATVAYKTTLQVFTFLGYFYFFLMLLYRIYSYGKVVLTQLLSWVQIINITFYIIQLGFRYQSYGLMAGGGFSSYHIGVIDFLGQGFIDIRPPVRAMRLAITFQSMNTFLNWFKMVGYLASYPVFALMTKTLEHAAAELRAFSIVFCIIMFGFAQAHCMFYGKQLASYRTIVDSFLTLFRAMLGDFNFEEMYEQNYVIGPLFFIMFVGIAFLVVLNIIIAIVADAYVQANEERKEYLNRKRTAKDARKRLLQAPKKIKFPRMYKSNKVASTVFAKRAAAVLVAPKQPGDTSPEVHSTVTNTPHHTVPLNVPIEQVQTERDRGEEL